MARRAPSEAELPRLGDERGAEAGVALLAHEGEPLGRVDPPGREQDALRPERDRAVAGLAREAHALVDEALADAEATRARIDDEEAELGHPAGALHEKHGAHALAVLLRDPG